MVHREESRHDFAFIAGVIVGAISGALVTLALTPMSGEQAREKVRERVGDLEPVKERATGLATSAQQLVETGRGKATELVAKAQRSSTDEAPAPTHETGAAATVYGEVPHPQDPAEGAREATEGVEGDGVVETQQTGSSSQA